MAQPRTRARAVKKLMVVTAYIIESPCNVYNTTDLRWWFENITFINGLSRTPLFFRLDAQTTEVGLGSHPAVAPVG